MRKLIISLLLILLLISACKNQQKKPNPNRSYKNKLVVYCTDTFRKSGLESVVVPDFARKNDCQLELVLFRNAGELSAAIKNPDNYGKYDLVLGLDNGFAISDSLLQFFVQPDDYSALQLTKETVFDPTYRLIPYAYSNLGLIYNTQAVSTPPQSFGELQDARYLAQIALCDPHDSGVGRATLFWSLALFGAEGYEHLWKSLRKNIYKSYPDRNEALDALKNGQCSMLLSLNTIPAYLEELDPQNTRFDISMLKEGSYQYIESIGIHRGSSRSTLAGKFIKHLLSSEPQKMVVYKLGMFPANPKTLLPMHFSTIPFTSYSVNSRISQSTIYGQLNLWLDFWDRLFSFQI